MFAGLRRLARSSSFVSLVILCLAVEAFPQATSGTILGRVTDTQEAVVPEATVTATNAANGFSREVRSNADGDYAIGNLPPGIYTVRVERDGFASAVSENVKLEIDQKLRFDVSLSVGGVAGSVTVTAEAPLLQTQSTETGEVIDTKRIRELPLLGRNFLELTSLTPGVAPGSGGNNVDLRISGQREFGNSILVDGIEVTGNRNNDTSLRPSVDAVQEFKVLTSGYAPEFGRAAGGVIAIQTLSGGNDIHGSLYEYFRPNNTAARSFFSDQRSQLKQHNFGGSIGGPIRKNRTFFFGSYEGFRLRDAFSYLDTVPPTDQIRFLPNGDVDLSGLRDPNTGNTVPIFDPQFYAENFFSQQFEGNIIPANRVSQAGLAILRNFFPAPNAPGTLNGYFGNFRTNQRFSFDSDTVDARVDHTLSDNDTLSGVYHVAWFDSLLADRFAGAIPVDGGGDADRSDAYTSTNQSISITETHVFGNGFVNELRFGYVRSRFDEVTLMDGRDLADQFGIGNINLPGFPQTTGIPTIFLSFGATTGGSTFKPLNFLDSNYQFIDNLAMRVGKHEVKVGADFRLLSSRPIFSLFPTGFQFYAGAYSSLTSDPTFTFFDPSAYYGNGGSEIADLLLGLPLTVTLGLQLTEPKVRSYETHFYGQDTWQVTDRLTLNYGLRYEYQAPYVEVDDQISNFDVATKKILVAGRGGNSRSLVEPDRNNFAPRLGFALRVGSDTVVRGAYGIFFSPENDARNDILTKNYPFAQQQDFFNDVNQFYGTGFPSYLLDTGVPRTTTIEIGPDQGSIDPSDVPNGGNQALFALDPNFRTGYSQLYNLVVQHQFSSTLAAEVGYVGSLGRKLSYSVGNINLDGRITPELGSLSGQFPIGLSSYNSLQAKLTRRFANGLNLLASYTYGKSIDNGPAPFNLGRNRQRPQDPFNLRAERAVSAEDITHSFVASGIYELPIGRGRRFLSDTNRVVDAILGGYQVSAIVTFRSGLPVNVVRNGFLRNFEGLRPNLVGDPTLPESQRTLERYFDTTAFSVDGLGATEPGSAGRNVLRGPGYSNLDLGFYKEFALGGIREGTALQLRFEFFNLTNTPNFARPNGDLSQGDFGRITGTVGNPRIIQFALRINY